MKETAPSLFKRSKAGDERAFRNIYDNHKAAIYRYALTITRDVQQAEDVTQEAFLKLYKAQHRYRDDSNLGALLFKITRNTALSHVAKARRFPRTLQTWGDDGQENGQDPLSQLPDDRALPDACSMHQELRQHVMQAIDSMPARLREVYLLHEFEGLSYQDISARLELSYHAVQKRFTRALEYLQVTVEIFNNQHL
ncbi:MAG: sigma-70 family RNA polymerase sigma factor [Verrucomicrobiota bacterium]|jgi:RNA polymerase sigma-70 factor (ECF subfamily)|nr:sigma-70 family RNA polymerase sigma factor [Verrucomicrobiota bacterium]MDD8046594.1 sigma-70 family RNA polymerase sigma factor [Verrucomicrobiota bacterium]